MGFLMMSQRTVLLLTIVAIVRVTLSHSGEFAYPPHMEGARTECYKTIGDTKLNLYIFQPPDAAGGTTRPAIVFFFGGGWTSGSPAQFETQCRYLASRGMVAIAADYRVAARHGVKAAQCVADARSAMRWVRAHATQHGIDPHRIAAGGGSAGGHLAAATAFIAELDDEKDDKTVNAAPDALVLFNPALVLAPLPDVKLEGFASRATAERFGAKPEQISPAHHVVAGGPPAIIFHGRADTTVPFAMTQSFADKMKAVGNRCELHAYDGQQHGFFNHDPWRTETLIKVDRFLASLGWLQGQPTLKLPEKTGETK